MMTESSEKMYCVPCCAMCEEKCFGEHNTPLCLEPHACVMHVKADDKTNYGTPRENHVCGNVILRASLVSCVHPPSLTKESPLPVSENTLSPLKKSLIP